MPETPEHLYQPPLYCYGKNRWTSDFNFALKNCSNEITLDIAAVFSFISFGYICNNRTLIQEISRRPWLSKVDEAGCVQLLDIPPHNFYFSDYKTLSSRLYELLLEEVRSALIEAENVFVLLSGGLDSRIVAGILKQLKVAGEIRGDVIALTWGLENSRDVVYAHQISKSLGMEWQHIPLTHKILLENIDSAIDELGLLHSPELLHNMAWLNKNLPDKSIVFAGSFGDSIGRGEFGGLHLLQLKHPIPNDQFNILHDNAKLEYNAMLKKDIHDLFKRAPGSLPYMNYEHFMQGYRMNGGLCHALSIVKGKGHVYQMFTAPKTYQFIWSLHPSFRNDEIYKELLSSQFPEIAGIPWARTNRALGIKTQGALPGLHKNYHDYSKWTRSELRDNLEEKIDLDWFNQMGIFNPRGIDDLRKLILTSNARVSRINDIWLWLAAFPGFFKKMESLGKKVIIPKVETQGKPQKVYQQMNILSRGGYLLKGNAVVNKSARFVRKLSRQIDRERLQKSYLKIYPPQEMA